jgi:SNF2 family DNA or RNA helicase
VGEINGATSASARKAILANIPSTGTKYVLLLQIKVGCEGLNLQEFSEVYFLSPNWNPAVEDQAVARCHRIGQTVPVDIFRFSMEGFGRDTQSIDTYITERQNEKRKVMVNSDQCWEPTNPNPTTQA